MIKNKDQSEQEKARAKNKLKVQFQRAHFNHINEIEKHFDELADVKHSPNKKDAGFIQSLDEIESLLAKNQFNSEQVDVYYKLMHREQKSKKSLRFYSVIAVSFILFFLSLYLLIGDIPVDLKGAAIFYFNYHDALTMSDLAGIALFFISSLLFITQMVKLNN